MRFEQAESELEMHFAVDARLLGSLIERALSATERAREAQQAVLDGRAYLRLLCVQRTASRDELQRAARTVRAWRAQSRWLAATALTLQERANTLGARESFLPFPELGDLREELELLRLVRQHSVQPVPPRTLGREPRRRRMN